jgi:glycosyltransferase involved in cell wall biosynthesis
MASSFSSITLIGYPLSSDFKYKLQEILHADTQEVAITEIRKPSYFHTFFSLFAIQAFRLYIPFEDSNSASLLPILKLLACFTRVRSIFIISPDLRIVRIRRFRILLVDIPLFFLATLSCFFAGIKARVQSSLLLKVDRINSFRASHSPSQLLYLKTNLWFGIKAGGSVGHISGIVNGFIRRGFPIAFASGEPPVMVDHSASYIPVPLPASYGIPYELNNFRFQFNFERTLVKNKVLSSTSAIYQRLSASNYLGAFLSRKYRIPLIVEYNGSEVWVAQNWGGGLTFPNLAISAEKAMLKHAHLVVTVSDVLREQLIDFGVEPSRIVTYPNCVDPTVYRPDLLTDFEKSSLRSELSIPASSLLFTFVGTFGPWHGAEKLADAIIELNQSHGDWLNRHPVHFLFVGDGATLPLVKDMIYSANACHLCTFLGLVPQAKAPEYLALSDVLVSPHVPNKDGSKFFGSPTKLFEYMATGKPIIASSLEQISQVLSPSLHITKSSNIDPLTSFSFDQVAITIPPGSVIDLVSAIIFITENPHLRNTFAENARSTALRKYTWDSHLQEILDRARHLQIFD